MVKDFFLKFIIVVKSFFQTQLQLLLPLTLFYSYEFNICIFKANFYICSCFHICLSLGFTFLFVGVTPLQLLPTKAGKQWVNSPRLCMHEKVLSLLLILSNYLKTNIFYSPFKEKQQTSHLAVFVPWFSGLLALVRGLRVVCILLQVEGLLPCLAWSFSLIFSCAKGG